MILQDHLMILIPWEELYPRNIFPHLPNILLRNNQYFADESVRSDSATGIVNGWDPKTGILRISSKENFVVGEIIEGVTSKTQGIAKNIGISRFIF